MSKLKSGTQNPQPYINLNQILITNSSPLVAVYYICSGFGSLVFRNAHLLYLCLIYLRKPAAKHQPRRCYRLLFISRSVSSTISAIRTHKLPFQLASSLSLSRDLRRQVMGKIYRCMQGTTICRHTHTQ